MMKKIPILLILLFTAMISHAQLTGWVPYKSKNVNIGLAADSLMYMPVKDTTHTPQRIGALTMRPQDSSVYVGISKTAPKKWVKVFTGEATTSLPISSLTAATGTNSINNGDYQQTWNWNSLSGYGFLVQSSATTASNGSRLLYVQRSGTNSNAGVTSYSGYFSNSHIGTSSTNIAGLFSAQSGTNNYAIIVPSGGGNVGFGTSTPNASALLDVESTTQGAVLPRMNTTQMNAISSPVAGLMVYNSDSLGYCFYNGTAWLQMGSGGGGSGSTELAHQGLVKNGDYIGLDSNGVNPLTRDVLIDAANRKITFENDRGSFVFDNPPYPLARINGTGLSPLFQVDSGGYTRFRIYPKGQIFAGDSINLNLFIGYNSGLNIVPEGLPGNPPGRWNVSLGTNALRDIVNGNDNIAIGQAAANSLISGTHNIAIGTATLNTLTTGADNIAIGVDVLANNNNIRNVAIGSYSQYLKTGQLNTSVGAYTLGASGGGSYNSAFGYSALGSLTTAENNIGIGYYALASLTTGSSYLGSNVAVGGNAGYTTNGDWNVFLGYDAGRYSNENNAFYLHSRATISEDYGKNASMLYGKFGDYGANTLRMNGKFGIHSLNNDAAWMPDSSFHVVGNSWLNGKLRITDGTQSNGYVLTSDANGNASWQAASGGSGVTTVGTFSGSSQTNGASISGSTITFGPADATNSGMVSTGSQTFAGAKELRWKARVGSTTSSATPTINTDNYDIYKLTAQTADITSFTTNLSGTPNDGDILEIQITGTAARSITWGASFVSTTVTLPTTTTSTNTLTVILQYYTTSSYGNNKWHCVNYY